MGPIEFTDKQLEFIEFDGVSFLGGCCGTTPKHQCTKQSIGGKIPQAPDRES